MTSLNQIRESLATVQSYKIPERYKPTAVTPIDTGCTQQLLDPETIQRYRNARSKYLRSQITNLILEHLKTLRYDKKDEGENSKPIIQFPESISEEEHELLRQNVESAKGKLRHSVSQVKQSYEGVYHKYRALEEKRNELKNIVNELESKELNTHSGMNIDGEEVCNRDGDITDASELELQGERLESLEEKRSMLEAKLRKIRMETENVSSQIASKEQLLQQMANASDASRKGNSGEPSSSTVLDVDNLDVEATKAETDQIRQQTQNLKDMSEFYESMKSATEVISGIKILSVTDAKLNKENGDVNVSPRKISPRQKRSHSIGRLEDAFALKIQLLNQHIVEIILGNSKGPGNTGECFRVISARLLTPSVLTDTLIGRGDYESNPTPTVSIVIPPLDDLVTLATNLEPGQDLRFVLRESLARVRTLSARMNELAFLRTKYLTKITNPTKNKVSYGFGGEDQEILCSLDSQITVVIRLTADCPILKGSAYIQRIVGCGGWEDSILQKIKTKVNEQRSNGPVDLMEALVAEVSKVVQEDNIKIPKTPILPRKRGNSKVL